MLFEDAALTNSSGKYVILLLNKRSSKYYGTDLYLTDTTQNCLLNGEKGTK